MLSNIKADQEAIARARRKVRSYDKDPDKIFYLIGSAYGKHNEHHFIFLSEDGQDKRYTIDTTYPRFHIRNMSKPEVASELSKNRKMSYVKEIRSNAMKNAITQKEEVVVTVSTYNPNNVTSRKEPERAISPLFDPDYTHNNHSEYFHVVLNDNGLIMGMPYRFKKGKPVMVLEGVEDSRHLYKEIFKMIPEEALDVGENLLSLIHAQLPPWSKMIVAIDIEIQANHGESMNPELAEVPITSIACTNHEETVVYTLTNELLGIDPPANPETFNDGTFTRYLFDSERELLEATMQFIDDNDQKIIVTYSGDSFDIPYMSRRFELLNIQHTYGIYGWEMKGGFSSSAWKKSWFKKWKGKYLIDLLEYFANGNVRTGAYNRTEYEDLKLDTVAKAIIGRGKYEYEGKIEELSSEELSYYNCKDTQLTFDLATHDDDFPALILFFIMRFGNLSLENANRRGVTSWWGGFFFRYMTENNILFPNKSQLVRDSPEKLKGGTVLDAETGVYTDITLLDFSSLYPTMIIFWNICFSTINCAHWECQPDQPNSRVIEIPGAIIWTCTQRIGYMPAVLSFLRNARVHIYKPLAKTDSFYKKLSDFFKIFMNAGYGVFANYGFPFAHDFAAQAVTATSRDKLDELVVKIGDLGGDVHYGDSVVGSEAIIFKFAHQREFKAEPFIMSFSEAWSFLGDRYETVTEDGKERMYVKDLFVWSRKGWNEVHRVIRHFTYKSIYRVATGLGSVDITEDHSLVDSKGREFKPQEISTDKKRPVTAPYPLQGDVSDEEGRFLLMFLFSMVGTAANNSNTGYHSQKSVMLQFNPNCIRMGLEILEQCEPIINKLETSYNSYTTGKGKLMIKFKSHVQLHKLVRAHCYGDKGKIKPYPRIFMLEDKYLRLVYDFLVDYYYRPDKKKVDRWTIKSSAEMVVFSSLAEKFDKGKFTFIPQPRGKLYHARRSSKFPRKVTLSVVKTTAEMVYDLDTKDGTFMAGNIDCHNTDSVFATDIPDDAADILSDQLGIEVENEGSFKKFILYMKKNYIKMNPDEKKIMGMSGKKKNNCKLVRKAFKETVDKLTIEMNNQEMLDYVYQQIRRYEEKIINRDFNMDDVKITQALSMDIGTYKANTPLVQAANNFTKALNHKGVTRNIGRKGVIIEYVKVSDKRVWMPTQMTNIDSVNVDHYVTQLYKVFRQLTVPLGMEVKVLKESKEQRSLEDWSY